METRAPTLARIMIAVGFAISCFGLLLFLWLAFGGPVPLKPEGYRFKIPFDEATSLATESDVRISGISVGKVKQIDLAEGNFAEATVELQERYAPIPTDTRAILRQKTLLGETYVELTPGSEDAKSLPEDGTLAAAQVSEAVQLDEIFRTFDERTRTAFRAWMQGQAAAFRGRGDDFSAAIASLDPFAQEANRVLRVLDSQGLAVRRLVRDGGEVFEALSERRGQLRGLISNGQAVFETTARRNAELAQTFEILPTFLRESRLTLSRLERFAADTDPLVRQLRPAARELSPTLIDAGRLAPQLDGFFDGLEGTIRASRPGLPAVRRLLDDHLPPLLGRLDPYLADLNSLLEGARLYRNEITAFLANVAAATNAFLEVDEDIQPIHHLRTEAPLGPESLAAFPRRLQVGRTNPYVAPLGYLNLSSALESFETRQCATGIRATLDPGDAGSFPTDLFDRLKLFAFADELDSNDIPTPPCVQQDDFPSIGVTPESTQYLHVREQP